MKKLVILGGGESGVGAAVLGKEKGWDVFLSDKSLLKQKYKEELNAINVRWEEGKHTEEEILSANCIIKSPGIPDKVELIQKAKEKGIEIISEIEFAYRYTKGKIIAITGSNGKTTTTSLLYYILKNAGLNVGVGGNIGYSFARMVAQEDKEYYVLEISSFQLDGIKTFKPNIALLLNITPDHLDRYDYKMENYIASKFRITENQTEEDYLIYDADDPITKEEIQKRNIKAQIIPFTLEREVKQGAYCLNNEITSIINNNTMNMSANELTIKGKHNVKNAMAATIGAQLVNIRKQTIRENVTGFKGVEHRLDFVREINNVRYINDSKATNINSVYFALESMSDNVILILGGQDKGNDYNILIPFVKQKVKAIICLGLDNEKIKQTFQSIVPQIIETKSMIDAVTNSHNLAKAGDTVLLSPACASFDLFTSYEDRGNQFVECVKNL
ncbi:MAG: UDP-N-acetylmuramoyl-L-alanine--D-glutamate ligase [Capnocytophaga sp.]|nr:UDP-N-acetylmuramoyl-L-alanine--D-glutamate ligase [Capnocytophaga sp.]